MIVEIALGIVLAVLILAFLPQLLVIGVVVLLLGLLAVGGVLGYTWFVEHPSLPPALLALLLCCVILVPLLRSYLHIVDFRDLHFRARRRREMGYDATELEKELDAARRALSSNERRLVNRFPAWFGLPPPRDGV
jgi:hypothetical protein